MSVIEDLERDNKRADLAHRITKAEETNDLRSIVFLCRQFIDLLPEKLFPIDRAIKKVFLKKLVIAKSRYMHICPVCGKEMIDQLCPDDVIRPYCDSCGKTYTPMGYDCEETYGTRWSAVMWAGMVEDRRVISIPVKQ